MGSKAGKTSAVVAASDYQETKNINTVGNVVMPNTNYRPTRLTVVDGPTVTWIEPPARVCALKRDSLVVVAASTSSVREVIFRDGGRTIGVDTRGPGGIYSTTWKTGTLKKGVRHLTATVVDAKGRSAAAGRRLKICQ